LLAAWFGELNEIVDVKIRSGTTPSPNIKNKKFNFDASSLKAKDLKNN